MRSSKETFEYSQIKKIALNKKSRTRDSSSKHTVRNQTAEVINEKLPLRYLTLMNLKKYSQCDAGI